MKSIMLSVRPEWVEKILNGEKTIEIRKTMPKCELPIKVYIYCRKSRYALLRSPDKTFEIRDERIYGTPYVQKVFCELNNIPNEPILANRWNEKVVAEFTLNKIDEFACKYIPYVRENNLGYEKFIDNGVYKIDGISDGIVFERYNRYIDTMLNNTDFAKMCINPKELYDYVGTKNGYDWHITYLKIYDKPKELSEFYHHKKYDWWDYGHHTNKPQYELESLEKSPQNWCYVEER